MMYLTMNWGDIMFMKNDVSNVKKDIEKFVGSRIKLEASKGRQKITTKEGIIENAYQSIFIVQLYEKCLPTGKVSYSYTDILTKAIEITICD